MAKLVSFDDFNKALSLWNKVAESENSDLIKKLSKGAILRDGQTIPFFISTLSCGKMLPYVSDGLVDYLGLVVLDHEIAYKVAQRLEEEETLKAKAKAAKAKADKAKAREAAIAAKQLEEEAKASKLFDDVLKSLGSMEW